MSDTKIYCQKIVCKSYSKNRTQEFELGFSNGRFVDVKNLKNPRVLNFKNLTVVPGLVDLCVQMRDQNSECRATFASETIAAISGGVTTLLAMPNNFPIIDSPGNVKLMLDTAKSLKHCSILVAGSATLGAKGRQITEMYRLMRSGCIALMQGYPGFSSSQTALNAMLYAKGLSIPLILQSINSDLSQGVAHDGHIASNLGLTLMSPLCETLAIGHDLELAEVTGCQIHFQKITCEQSVKKIREAKRNGLKISADVSLAHLLFNEKNLSNLDPIFHLSQPLRTIEDQNALLEGILDGTIDAIVSDHNPRDARAKLTPFAESQPGMNLIETFLPALFFLANEKKLDIQKLISAVTKNPANALNIEAGEITPGYPANFVLIDLDNETEIKEDNRISTGVNNPLFGVTLPSKIISTWSYGRKVWPLDSKII